MQTDDAIAAVYRGLLTGATNNDLITEALVIEALQRGLDQFARDTEAYTRSYTDYAVDSQAAYTLPDDVYLVSDVQYGESALTRIGLTDLKAARPTYRSDDAGTPCYWYRKSDFQLGLYSAPSLLSYTITAWTRNSNVVTVTLDAAHSRLAGDVITITGSDAGAIDGTFTLTAVGTLTLTFAQTGGNVLDSDGGGTAWATEALLIDLVIVPIDWALGEGETLDEGAIQTFADGEDVDLPDRDCRAAIDWAVGYIAEYALSDDPTMGNVLAGAQKRYQKAVNDRWAAAGKEAR